MVKTWNDSRAWDITCRLEAHIRENQPKGWRASPEEDQRFDELLRCRSRAGNNHDMEAWEAAHLEMLRLCMSSWERFIQETPKLTSKSKPPKKTGKVST